MSVSGSVGHVLETISLRAVYISPLLAARNFWRLEKTYGYLAKLTQYLHAAVLLLRCERVPLTRKCRPFLG